MVNKKTTLRKIFTKLLGQRQNHNHDDLLGKLLLNQKFIPSKSILIYLNVEAEIATKKLIEYCWQNNKIVYAPFLQKLEIGQINSWREVGEVMIGTKTMHELKTNPINHFNLKIDLIVVPGLAFDKEGYRLGHGVGWYDRFLAMHPETYKIGVCYKEQVVDELPHEDWDIKMDEVVVI